MKCFTGIDLGSTTTKAVVLDEHGEVLGRGITNSRSNYDVACEVARHEAFMDVRFNLLSERIGKADRAAGNGPELLEALKKRLRLEQYMSQLAELEATCRMNGRGARQHGELVPGEELEESLSAVFEALRGDAEDLFLGDAKPRSDFFRDIAGSGYMTQAELVTKTNRTLHYETLIGIFDKSIITVESEVPQTQLQDMVDRALLRVFQDFTVPEEARREFSEIVREVVATPLTEAGAVGTGYGRARLPFARENIRSEILCHGLGAHATFPGTRTVLDIGGQDTKAIQVDANGIVTSFQMNDRCAAGCGRYLGYIADEMNLGLHELGPLAQRGKKPVRISSTCTVFAGAELRDRLAMGQRREDILAGLHRSIMLRAMSLLARSGGIERQFTFTGGVANNVAAVEALHQLVKENYDIDEINISPDSIYTGALGAAIFALRGDELPVSEAQLAGGAA